MPRSLVLNSTHQPLAVVPARRAVVLVLKEKAVLLASNGAAVLRVHDVAATREALAVVDSVRTSGA